MRILLAALLPALVVAGPPRGADADEPQGETRSTMAGLSAGAEVGTLAGGSLRYGLGPQGEIGLKLGVGSGLWTGSGLHVYLDATWGGLTLSSTDSMHLAGYVGLGLRHYRHDYAPASFDELPDRHTGARLPLGLSAFLIGSSLEIFGELAPGVDFARSPSCTFLSGVDTLCPHTAASPYFLSATVGARYYLF